MVRELEKLERHTRAGIVLFPRYNGESPPRVPPPKPWEPFLPGLEGNEGNWEEWEVGGRAEAERNPWVCRVCKTKNRPLYAHPGPAPRETCEGCGEVSPMALAA